MNKRTIYFAYRETLIDNTSDGHDISHEYILTIAKIVKGRVELVTSRYYNATDKDILEQFLYREAGFRRRKEKILHLITDCTLLLSLIGTSGFEETIGENDDSPTLETLFHPMGTEDYRDHPDELINYLESIGVKVIEDISENSIDLSNIIPLCADRN